MTMCLVFDMSCPYFDDLTCMCTLANPTEDCDDYAVYTNEDAVYTNEDAVYINEDDETSEE